MNIAQIPPASIAIVIAALIAGAMSFVNLILSKEQKTSEFRQAWIDGLRGDLAIFFSSARGLCRTMEESRSPSTDDEDIKDFKFAKEKIGNMRLASADSLYRIKLRLNKNEPEHKELSRLLESAINTQNRINIDKGKDYTEALAALELAVSYSQDILKNEWERVKLGEKPFRVVKNIAMLLGIVCFVIFIGWLCFTIFVPLF
jgi:type I site-specific restriction-modification system R (restriction) subunit